MPGCDVSMRTQDGVLNVRAKVGSPIGLPAIGKPSLELDLAFDITAQPALTVISELDTDPPLVSTTGKSSALPVTGRLVVRHAGLLHAFDFTDAIGGFDYTNGYLPRRTQWRWAYLTGRLADGRTVGLNLSADFTGLTGRAHENSVWLDGQLHAIDPDASIDFDINAPENPWHVRTSDGKVDLEFSPIAVHRESQSLRVVSGAPLAAAGRVQRDESSLGRRTADTGPSSRSRGGQDVLW